MVSVLVSKKAGDGDPGAALPQGASTTPKTVVPSRQPPPKPDAEHCLGSPSTRVRAKPDRREHKGKGHESIFLMNPSKPSWGGRSRPLLPAPGEFLWGGSGENQQQQDTCSPVTASLNY